jgi:hypothetical protein
VRVTMTGWSTVGGVEREEECGEVCPSRLAAVSQLFAEQLTRERGRYVPHVAWLKAGPHVQWVRTPRGGDSGDGGESIMRPRWIDFSKRFIRGGSIAEDLTVDGVSRVVDYARATQACGAPRPPMLAQRTVLGLVVASAVMRVKALFSECTQWLGENLWPRAALTVLGWPPQPPDVRGSMREWYTTLRDKCFRYLLGMFNACVKEPLFLRLPHAVVKAMVRHDGLASKEETVLAAIMRWVKHDDADRERHVEGLLRLVRFPHMASEVALNDEDSQVL